MRTISVLSFGLAYGYFDSRQIQTPDVILRDILLLQISYYRNHRRYSPVLKL
jgi:hypothetical protein